MINLIFQLPTPLYKLYCVPFNASTVSEHLTTDDYVCDSYFHDNDVRSLKAIPGLGSLVYQCMLMLFSYDLALT